MNKQKAAKLSIIVIGLIGTIAFLSSSPSKTDLLLPRMLFLGASNSQVITSERNMTVCGGMFSSQNTTHQSQCSVYSTVQDMVAKQNSDNTLTVYVVYKQFNQQTEVDPTSGISLDQPKMIPLKQEQLNLILKATLTQEGLLMRLETPSDSSPSEMLVRLTERLLEQYFPNLNSTLYQTDDTEGNLLRSEQGESSQPIVEDSYLGKVAPIYKIAQKVDGTVELSKSYTQDNFVNYEETSATKMPDVAYNSTFIVKDGNVQENKEVLVFSLNQQGGSNESFNLGASQNDEIIGSINARIESSFRLISTGTNKTLTTFIKNYEKNSIFVPIDLTIADDLPQKQENKTMLSESGSEILFQKDYSIFDLNALSNNINLKVGMTTYEGQSQIISGIYLNSKSLYTIFEKQIEHNFIKCDDVQKIGEKMEKKMNVLSYTHQLLGGIVKIPIQVSIGITFGWSFTQSKGQNNICQIDFEPTANPIIEGVAKVTFWQVAEAGIEAKGSVANTSVHFGASIDKSDLTNVSAQLSGKVSIIPYSYQIQLYYTHVECSATNIFKSIFTSFSFSDACVMGDKEYYLLAEGKSDKNQQIQLFNSNVHLNLKNIINQGGDEQGQDSGAETEEGYQGEEQEDYQGQQEQDYQGEEQEDYQGDY